MAINFLSEIIIYKSSGERQEFANAITKCNCISIFVEHFGKVKRARVQINKAIFYQLCKVFDINYTRIVVQNMFSRYNRTPCTLHYRLFRSLMVLLVWYKECFIRFEYSFNRKTHLFIPLLVVDVAAAADDWWERNQCGKKQQILLSTFEFWKVENN